MKYILFIIISSLVFVSCSSSGDSDSENGNETKVSSKGLTESHYMGRNCVDCHVSGGSGEGWFTVSGTVYQSDNVTAYPNGEIKLYSGANQTGTLVKTIAVDGLGNFYTTESVSFSAGLYPVVVYNGQTKSMKTPANGSCNACHISGGLADNVISGP